MRTFLEIESFVLIFRTNCLLTTPYTSQYTQNFECTFSTITLTDNIVCHVFFFSFTTHCYYMYLGLCRHHVHQSDRVREEAVIGEGVEGEALPRDGGVSLRVGTEASALEAVPREVGHLGLMTREEGDLQILHTHTYTFTHTNVSIHSYTHTYTHTHTQTCIHSHNHTHTHTHTHTHSYTTTHNTMCYSFPTCYMYFVDHAAAKGVELVVVLTAVAMAVVVACWSEWRGQTSCVRLGVVAQVQEGIPLWEGAAVAVPFVAMVAENLERVGLC